MIDQICAGESVELRCAVFDVSRSCLYAYRERAQRVDAERMALHSRVHELFVESRGSAGSRSIMGMMREEGTAIGRFTVSRLMEELGLICKQPGSHAYKQATVERIDIPNHLNRQFEVDAPNQVWCGDITYVWAQGRWHYLAAVLDLFTRRVVGWAFSTRPDADLVVQALDMAYEQRGRPQGLLFHSDQGGQYAESEIPSAPVALSDTAEHEPSRKLSGQFSDGEAVPQLQDRMAAVRGLHVRAGSTPGYRPLPDAPVQLDTAASVQ